MKFLKVFFLAFVMLFISCKEKTATADKIGASPSEVFKHNNSEIPYYEFDEFEKFLNIKDDQIYVINFWATWCMPCVEELPYFETINATYKHKGVNVILVSLDKKKEIESRLFPFIEKNDIRSQVIVLNSVNPNKWIDSVDPNWSGAIPITIIYNKNKREFYEKTFTLEELKNKVEKFL